MKKILLLALVAVCIGIAIPNKAHAVDITVGATTWYAWWDFNQEGMDIDPTFLYGPALAVKFNDDFNLTFIYLYGKFDSTEKDDDPMKSEPVSKDKIKRSDSDLALNYRLNDFLKLFAGMKYMNFKSSGGFVHGGYGPGLGLSATFPVAENLFLLGTFSGFYLWGNEEHGDREDYKFKESGFNSSLALAYYIAPASTTINLGGRYQYFKTDYNDSSQDGMSHKFYGITLTATYTFSI